MIGVDIIFRGEKMKITKRFGWVMGHRLTFHKGGCQNIHGHNWELKISVEGKKDKNGMVIDFSIVKELLMKYVHEPFDHGFMWYKNDEKMERFFRMNPEQKGIKVDFEPTSENISEYLFKILNKEVMKQTEGRCKVNRIKIYETSTSESACYS